MKRPSVGERLICGLVGANLAFAYLWMLFAFISAEPNLWAWDPLLRVFVAIPATVCGVLAGLIVAEEL